ncbi:MAG: sigma-70 family RNA polymerase sigma factor [Planctomycetes bacterium]|nr:sigma-70 family RNA polymerase sigma factor [Planctomycetota bacterium]
MTEAVNINIDDRELVKRCQRGDSRAMETLIVRYQNRIYNVILKMCGNVDDAAELSQDAFVKAIENIYNFEGRSSFYTWLFRIAVNLTLNFCKRNVKLGITSIEADNCNEQTRTSLKEVLTNNDAPNPAAVTENREICDLIIKAIMNLDDDQRAVVVLRDIEGMNYSQIADVLDIELGTVKSRLSRARGNLRESLEVVIK